MSHSLAAAPMSRSLAAAALVACSVLQPAAAGWVESYDKKSNKKFYYDEETRKTQWEKPDGEREEHGIGRRRPPHVASPHIRCAGGTAPDLGSASDVHIL